jgi:hypothetical protein
MVVIKFNILLKARNKFYYSVSNSAVPVPAQQQQQQQQQQQHPPPPSFAAFTSNLP